MHIQMDERQEKKDVFQNDSIPKVILAMAIPTIVSQMITVLYNYADTIFIGLLNDSLQTAAIALALPLTFLITAIANCWGIGGGSMISRSLGKRDLKGAKYAAAFSFYGALIFTIICSMIAFGMGDAFVYLLGASAEDLSFTDKYVFWMFVVGALPSVLSQVLAHFARSLGFARQAGIGLTLGGLMNIALDPIFIFSFGFNLGVAGAAIATMLSNVISLAYFFVLFAMNRKKWSVSFRIADAIPIKEIAVPAITVGLPSALIPFLSAISNGVLNNLISAHGDIVVAAVGIAKKMDLLPANIALGITQGTLPLLAYSYGAGEKERLQKLLYTTGVLAFISTVIVVILLEIFATPIATLFIRDADTVWYATQFIRRLCLSVPLYAITLTVNSFFQAANRPKYSLVISVIRKGIFDLPLMVMFNYLFAATAIIWVQPIMDLITSVISLLILKHFLGISIERS